VGSFVPQKTEARSTTETTMSHKTMSSGSHNGSSSSSSSTNSTGNGSAALIQPQQQNPTNRRTSSMTMLTKRQLPFLLLILLALFYIRSTTRSMSELSSLFTSTSTTGTTTYYNPQQQQQQLQQQHNYEYYWNLSLYPSNILSNHSTSTTRTIGTTTRVMSRYQIRHILWNVRHTYPTKKVPPPLPPATTSNRLIIIGTQYSLNNNQNNVEEKQSTPRSSTTTTPTEVFPTTTLLEQMIYFWHVHTHTTPNDGEAQDGIVLFLVYIGEQDTLNTANKNNSNNDIRQEYYHQLNRIYRDTNTYIYPMFSKNNRTRTTTTTTTDETDKSNKNRASSSSSSSSLEVVQFDTTTTTNQRTESTVPIPIDQSLVYTTSWDTILVDIPTHNHHQAVVVIADDEQQTTPMQQTYDASSTSSLKLVYETIPSIVRNTFKLRLLQPYPQPFSTSRSTNVVSAPIGSSSVIKSTDTDQNNVNHPSSNDNNDADVDDDSIPSTLQHQLNPIHVFVVETNEDKGTKTDVTDADPVNTLHHSNQYTGTQLSQQIFHRYPIRIIPTSATTDVSSNSENSVLVAHYLFHNNDHQMRLPQPLLTPATTTSIPIPDNTENEETRIRTIRIHNMTNVILTNHRRYDPHGQIHNTPTFVRRKQGNTIVPSLDTTGTTNTTTNLTTENAIETANDAISSVLLIDEPIQINSIHTETKPIMAIITSARSTQEDIEQNNVYNTYLYRYLISSIVTSVSVIEQTYWNVQLYVAIDDTDTYWIQHWNEILDIPIWLQLYVVVYPDRGSHIPFNEIALTAYHKGADYFCRVNDDTEFITTDWITTAVTILQEQYDPPNLGVVGPRCEEGNTDIMTHDMVHRTHLEIFHGYYYPASFGNWFLDDWITNVYSTSVIGIDRSTVINDWKVKHWIAPTRYNADHGAGALLPEEYKLGRSYILEHISQEYPNHTSVLQSLRDRSLIEP
jgi:hypothetical protein